MLLRRLYRATDCATVLQCVREAQSKTRLATVRFRYGQLRLQVAVFRLPSSGCINTLLVGVRERLFLSMDGSLGLVVSLPVLISP